MNHRPTSPIGIKPAKFRFEFCLPKRRSLVWVFAFIVVCAFLFWNFYSEAKKNALRQLDEEQLIHAKQAAHGIEQYFTTWKGILASFAQLDEIVHMDADGERHLDLLYGGHKEDLSSVTRVDEKGRILYTVPHKEAIGSDISRQTHMRLILEHHTPLVSDVFKSIQGFDCVAFHVPVFKGAEFRGTLAIVINFQALSRRYLEVIRIGRTGRARVLSRDGTELYGPVPGNIGRTVFGIYINSPSILAMIKEMLKGKEGIATYTVHEKEEPEAGLVKYHAVYHPINLGNTFWSVAVSSSEKEVLASLASFRNKLLLIIGVIVLGGIVFSTVFVKAWVIVSEERKRKEVEEELRESEERFHLLIERAPDAIVVYDVDLDRFVEANASAEKLFGCSRGELLQSDPKRFYPPEQPDRREVGDSFSEHNEQVLAGEEIEFERIVRSAEGNDRLCEVRLVRLPTVSRKLIRASFIDSTERKRAERMLVESERRFRTLFEQAAVGVAEIDPLSGRFLNANKRYCDLVGLSLDEMLKTDFQSITHPDDLENDLSHMRSLIAGEIMEFNIDKRYIRKDGGIVWVNLTVYPTWLWGETPSRHIAIVEDITERKKTEDALRSSEEKFFKAFHATPDAIVISRASDGLLIEVNEVFVSQTGYSRDEAVHGTTLELNLWADPHDRELYFAEVREQGRVREMEASFRTRSGEIRDGLISSECIVLDNEPCFLTIIRDITERKKTDAELRQYRLHLEDIVSKRTEELKAANEKLKDLDRLKSMFIASMSHELRTPLNSIIGFTGMTLQGLSGELNDEQKDNLSRVYQGAKHLLSLITDVIDISKIEAGRIESYPEVFFLDKIIDEAIGIVSPQMKEKGLHLAVEAAVVQLNTDRKRLLQCLLNFLSNAVKYTEAGTITVTAKEMDGEVSIAVTDTGIGIAERDLPKVFEAFERLESHLRVKAGGTGLGLYLTRKIARNILRGDVSFQSKEGQGSTFTLRVPKDLHRI